MIHLPEGPDLKLSISYDKTEDTLWVDGNSQGMVLAFRPHGCSWRFGRGEWYSYDTDESERTGSIPISRNEALMILFSC